MKLYVLLMRSRDGAVEAQVAMTQAEMDANPVMWADALEAAREEVGLAPTNRIAAVAMGVVTLYLPEDAIEAALTRGSAFVTAGGVD